MRFIKFIANLFFIVILGYSFFILLNLLNSSLHSLLNLKYSLETKFLKQLTYFILMGILIAQIHFFNKKGIFYFKKPISIYLCLTILSLPLIVEINFIILNVLEVPFCYSYNYNLNNYIFYDVILRIIVFLVSIISYNKFKKSIDRKYLYLMFIGICALLIVMNLGNIISFLN